MLQGSAVSAELGRTQFTSHELGRMNLGHGAANVATLELEAGDLKSEPYDLDPPVDARPELAGEMEMPHRCFVILPRQS